MPEALEYLSDWLTELHGRSGVGMGGVVPLTYDTVYHWAVLTGRWPRPYEVAALLTLDAIQCHPTAASDG